jgi:hypothetical protein
MCLPGAGPGKAYTIDAHDVAKTVHTVSARPTSPNFKSMATITSIGCDIQSDKGDQIKVMLTDECKNKKRGKVDYMKSQ